LARHPLFPKEAVENHYSFTFEELCKHAKWLNFVALGDNCEIVWTEEIIEVFADRWDWEVLSQTVLVMTETRLSDAFVNRYRNRWEP
jgi:hypothetical protein